MYRFLFLKYIIGMSRRAYNTAVIINRGRQRISLDNIVNTQILSF